MLRGCLSGAQDGLHPGLQLCVAGTTSDGAQALDQALRESNLVTIGIANDIGRG